MPTFYDIARKTRNALPYMQNYGGGIGTGRDVDPVGMGQQMLDPDFYSPDVSNETIWFENANPDIQYSSFANAMAGTGADPDTERKMALIQAQEAKKQQAQNQKLALSLMAEQRQRQKNQQLVVARERALQSSLAKEKRAEDRRLADASNASVYKAGILDPFNSGRYLSQYKGSANERNAFALAMQDAARKRKESQEAREFSRSGTTLSRVSKAVQFGDQETWKNFGLKEEDLNKVDANALKGLAKFHDKFADTNNAKAIEGIRRLKLHQIDINNNATNSSKQKSIMQTALKLRDDLVDNDVIVAESPEINENAGIYNLKVGSIQNLFSEKNKPRWGDTLFSDSSDEDSSEEFVDVSNQATPEQIQAAMMLQSEARKKAKEERLAEQIKRDAAYRARRSPEQNEAQARRDFADTQQTLEYVKANPYSTGAEKFFNENPTRRNESAIQRPEWNPFDSDFSFETKGIPFPNNTDPDASYEGTPKTVANQSDGEQVIDDPVLEAERLEIERRISNRNPLSGENYQAEVAAKAIELFMQENPGVTSDQALVDITKMATSNPSQLRYLLTQATNIVNRNSYRQ